MKTKLLYAFIAVLLWAALFPIYGYGAPLAPINLQVTGDALHDALIDFGIPNLRTETVRSGGTLRIASGGTLDIQSGAIVNFPTGFIPWSSVNKTGSSLADLTTRSAGDLSSGTLLAARLPAFSGDLTSTVGTSVLTLNTVNGNVGTFASVTVNGKGLVTAAGNLSGDLTTSGAVATLATVATGATTGSSTAIPIITFNNKGLVTAVTTAVVIAPAGTLTGTTLAANVVSSSLTSVGTLTGGATGAGFTVNLGTSTISGVLLGVNGGTGVNNSGKTITLGGNLTTTGAFNTTFAQGASITITLPTVAGTLATLAGTEALTNKTYNGNTFTAGTGVLTIAAGKTLTQSNTLTYTGTDGSSVNFGTGGTVLYSGGAGFVSSITGTAGQITASASTGAVTLSIPAAVTSIDSVTGATALMLSAQSGMQINLTNSANGLAVFGTSANTEKTAVGNGAWAFNRAVSTGAIYDSAKYAFQWTHTGTGTAGTDYVNVGAFTGAGTAVNAGVGLVFNGNLNLLIGSTTDIPGTKGLFVGGTTASSSTTTGSFQTLGGAGFGGAGYFGGIVSASGTSAATGAAGTVRRLQVQTAGLARWDINASSVAESGSNAGSNFGLSRYDDSGNIIDSVWTVVRSTGRTTIENGPTFNSAAGAFPITSNGSFVVASTFTLTANGPVVITPAARTSGVASYISITPPSDTGITATQESTGFNSATATRTWADGTVALQRERLIAGLTYNKTTTAATFTRIFNTVFTAPIAGTGVTFTEPHTVGILDATSAASSTTGALVIATTFGTTATSIGLGGGNGNFGGTLTAGGAVNAGSNTPFVGTSSATATGDLMNIYAASLGTGPAFGSFRFGKGASTGDSAALTFGYAGANNAANTVSMGFFGINVMTMTRGTTDGLTTFNGTTDSSLFSNGAVTMLGGLGVTKAIRAGGQISTNPTSGTASMSIATAATTDAAFLSLTNNNDETRVVINGSATQYAGFPSRAGGIVLGNFNGAGGYVSVLDSGSNPFVSIGKSSTVQTSGTYTEYARFGAITGSAFSGPPRTSGTASYFTTTAPADTGITANTESIGVSFNLSATRTWADGTVTNQREALFQAPTYNKTTTAATFTKAATVAITNAPIAGAGVAITNPYAFWVQAGTTQLDGNLHVGPGVFVDTAGSTVSIKSGSNAKAGTFTLTSGAVTVANTSVTANSVIVATCKTPSGTRAALTYTVTAGSQFVVAGNSLDNSVYNFVIFEVN